MNATNIKQNLIALITCLIGGQAGLLLIVPPGNVAAVWPAAGIALALVLIYGSRVLPGILMAGIVIQTQSYIDTSSTETIITSIGSGTLISTGAALQAYIGAKLVHGILKNDEALLKERSIVLFFILAGCVSCITSATVGVSLLFLQGVLTSSDIAMAWSTWWVGDTIGVFVFAPITLCLLAKPRHVWRQRIVNVALPLCVLGLASFITFKFSYQQEMQKVNHEFERNALQFKNKLEDNIYFHLSHAQELKEYFDSSSEVTPDDFSRFIQPKLSRHSEIQAIEWIPKILHKDRSAFESRLGLPIRISDNSGEMKIAPTEEVYYPIQYVEPYANNEKALGFNIRNNPVVLQTTETAWASGKTAVTDAIKLVQESKNKISVVFYSPVFKHNGEYTQSNTFENLYGFAASVLRVDNELTVLNDQLSKLQLSFVLKNNTQILYSDKTTEERTRNIPSQFQFSRDYILPVANQEWQLQVYPAPGFISHYSSWSIWLVIMGGLLITGFSGVGLLMLTGRGLQTESRIKTRTEELYNEIIERQHVEQTLQESNERFRTAYEEAPIGMALVSEEHSIIEANQAFYKMLGYPINSLKGIFFHEITFLEDVQSSYDYHEKLFSQEIGNYSFEKRYLHKNGHIVWAQLAVSLVRDKNSKPLYAIAQIQDITDSKHAENALEKIHRVQSIVSQCNDALLYIKSEKQLLNKICEIIVEAGDYSMAGVGFLNDDEIESVTMVASYGHDAGFLQAANIILTDTERGHGPAGIAIRSRRPYIVTDTSKDPNFIPWREAALERGYRSTISLPLTVNNNVLGVLLVYSPSLDAFNEEEIALLEKLANNLAFGLNTLHVKEAQNRSEQRHRTLIEATTTIIWTTDESGGFVVPQLSWEKYTGQPWEEHKGFGWINKIHTDHHEKLLSGWTKAITELTPYECSGQIWNGNLNEWRDFEVNAIPVMASDGALLEWVGVITDITDQIIANKEIQKLSLSVEHSPSIVMITDKDANIEYVNQKFTQIMGYSLEETIGKKPNFFITEEISEASYRKSREVISSGKTWQGNFIVQKKNGETFLSSQTLFAIIDSAGNITNIVSIQEDITEKHRLSEQLSYQASHDDLTGLINRREFERRAKRLLTAVHNNKEEHALCYIDLDQFKVVNDTCGHIAGDELLRQVSSVLGSSVRKRDTLARLGGDEFGVLMEHCSLDSAHRVAMSLHKTIQDFQFHWEGHFFKVGVSIGLVPIINTTIDLTQLLRDADAACYLAKDSGRNRIHIYHPDDSNIVKRHGEMKWVERIYHALENNQFTLYAQIIEPLSNKPGKHYELLIRMIDQGGDDIPPGLFLPAAERYNLISKIDTWVIEHAFKLLTNHSQFLNNISFCSINLSGHSMADLDFLDFVVTQLRQTGIDGKKICFEITETAAISNLSMAVKFMSTLRGKGCKFALDDFGSGLSSFAYLKNLPVDYLKIDGIFIKDIVDDPIDHAMVRSINEIGQVMGMKTIAEFVENDVIKGMLKEIGVDYAQGYGIAKPVPLEDIIGDSDSGNIIKLHRKPSN